MEKAEIMSNLRIWNSMRDDTEREDFNRCLELMRQHFGPYRNEEECAKLVKTSYFDYDNFEDYLIKH
jgi:hypothetical protein